MKKTSEALDKTQDDVLIRRQLLETGKIRLVREPSGTAPKPEADAPEADKELRKQQSD